MLPPAKASHLVGYPIGMVLRGFLGAGYWTPARMPSVAALPSILSLR